MKIKNFLLAFSLSITSFCIYADECTVMPIGIDEAQFLDASKGQSINIERKASKGRTNFTWLTWSGKNSTPTLLDSLLLPGNSNSYINPETGETEDLTIGHWVRKLPGARNGRKTNKLVEDFQGQEIVLPVWDETSGKGGNQLLHVSNFAKVVIESFNLSGSGFLTLTFMGFTDCESEIPPPPSE